MEQLTEQINIELQKKLVQEYQPSEFRKIMRGDSIILICTLGTLLGLAFGL